MTRRRRFIVAALVGVATFGLAVGFRIALHQASSDFDQIVVGARRVLNGQSPYTTTPLPGLEWPIYYPMPAILLGVPFVGLPLAWAHPMFCGISATLFAWGMSKDGDAKLFALGTWPYILSVSLAQWGPILMAATALPMLGWLTIAKPNIGLALAAGYAPRWVRGSAIWVNAAAAVGLMGTSFLMRPHWIGEWLSVLATPTPHLIVPVTVLGGVVLLLSLVRWRRPEARMLATLACVPQTFSSYDELLVFLVPESRRQALVLVAATTVTTAVVGLIGPAANYADTVRRFAPLRIALVYVPAVVMILMRPNVVPGEKT